MKNMKEHTPRRSLFTPYWPNFAPYKPNFAPFFGGGPLGHFLRCAYVNKS